MNAQELELDHFEVYRIFPQQFLPNVVMLRGQFDIRGPERCQLEWRTWFANPVSKNGEPIFDKHAHLVGYRLREPMPQPPRVAKIENQFGVAEIHLGDAAGLLVPARKIERGLEYPEKLDHYRFYQAYEERQEPVTRRPIKLKDQFAKDGVEVMVYQVVGFAVPVEKKHEGGEFLIHNEKAHLALYTITRSRPIHREVHFEDQFRWGYASRFARILLAVPSVKHGWNEGD